MKFSVSKLIVWPRDDSKEARVVSFEETGINLITGSSRSGKSAIIKIIDYCLGSRSCSVPRMGPIRRTASWYGVVVRTVEGYKLFARRDPGAQESTDDFMLIESATPIVPERPTRNTNRATVKGLLDRLARLPQTNVDFDETGSGYKGRASFGDMTSFMFQPQSVVANENILFFETEDEEHARKLREIFPLVLGAVDSDTLIKQHRLAEVRRLLERRRRQRESLRASVEDYAGEVRGRYVSATELGFVRGDIRALDTADIAVLLARLTDVSKAWVGGRRPPPEGGASPAPRLAELRQREAAARTQLTTLRFRMVQLRELAQARHLSESVLARERERLAPTSWVMDSVSAAASCPLCGSENHTATAELLSLSERLEAVESQWNGIATIPPMLDAEEVELRRGLTQLEEELRQIRSERMVLEERTTGPAAAEEERAVFIGKLQEFLRIQGLLSGDADLETAISILEAEESELASQVNGDVIARRKEDALLLISNYARHYGQIVELENDDALITLDTRELTVRVINERGESAWLHQIGSGANHLGYHVATMLALHEFFVARTIPHVPSLLILDQPSQTQFPDDLDELAEQEELQAVHKAFEACDSAIERTQRALQVIVSEHAGRNVYEGIKNLTVVERWRRGRKLIPWHWDDEALADLNGAPADAALEDLLDVVVKPAILTALDLPIGTTFGTAAIEHAVFQDLAISFRLRCSFSVVRDSTSPGRGTPVRSEMLRTLDGAVTRDLRVSVAQGRDS